MKSSILTLVSEVAELSSGAKRLADRVFKAQASFSESVTEPGAQAPAPNVDVDKLKRQIASLDSQVRALAEALDDAHDVVLSEQERKRFRADFRTRLGDTSLYTLSTSYDVDYFQAQPRSIRPIICSVLIEIFEERSELPEPLWRDILLTGGVL